jgi:hypothetical protein
MTAESVRKIALETMEAKAISQTTESSKCYGNIISEIIMIAKKGGRFITINMSNVHYSVLTQLVGSGYFITDDGSPGYCIVSW